MPRDGRYRRGNRSRPPPAVPALPEGVLPELVRDRKPAECALCLRPLKASKGRPRVRCDRTDCRAEYHRIHHQDRLERVRAIRGGK